MTGESAAEQDEQDFSIPGQEDDLPPMPQLKTRDPNYQPGDTDLLQEVSGVRQAQGQTSGDSSLPQLSQRPSQGAGNGGNDPYYSDPNRAASDDSEMPRASGRALILGNLLKSILGGAMAGAAQGNPAMARGFGAQQQAQQQRQQQQRQQQKDQQDAMLAMDAHQINVVKFHTAQMQQAIMANQMPHLNDAHNQKIVDSLEQSTAFDRKEGLMQDEQEVDGEGMEAYSNAVKLAGQLNGKAGTGSQDRYKVGITDGSDLAHLKFNVYKANMNGSTTRKVFTGTDADGNPEYKEMTGKYVDLDALESKNRLSVTQDASKELGKKYTDQFASDKWLPPENRDDAEAQLSDLKSAANFVKTHKGFGDLTQTIQQRYAQVQGILARRNLPQNKQAQSLQTARAGAEIRADVKTETTDKENAESIRHAVNYADSYAGSGNYTGPGDFALTEQYLEAVKVSKGFRMGQAQFDRIDKGRSWVDSARAKWEGGTRGVLFGPEQRKEIVATMHMMAAAKGAGGGTPARPKNVPANAVWNQEARQWRLPQ